jgi:gas vesicle protein
MKETRMGKADGNKPGLYENIRKKRERIAAGSGEKMKKPGQKGAPSASDFKKAAKTAKPEEKEDMGMKKGCDCTDGAKGKCSCGKKDGGMKKSPYADGCGYMKDSVAAEFNAVLDSMGVEKLSKGEEAPDDDDRDDKKCGKSGIAENKKCTKGTAQVSSKKHKGSGIGKAMLAGALVGGAIGAGMSVQEAKQRESRNKGILSKIKEMRNTANEARSTGETKARITRTNPLNGKSNISELRALAAQQQGRLVQSELRGATRRNLNLLKAQVPASAARRRKARNGQ